MASKSSSASVTSSASSCWSPTICSDPSPPSAQRAKRALAEGKPPAPKILRAAPLLEQFRIAGREALCLVGTGAGHPRLPAGPIATEEVWAFAPDFSWVRTFSGFYRLGTPHPGEHRLAGGR